jgi:hypothetical protein
LRHVAGKTNLRFALVRSGPAIAAAFLAPPTQADTSAAVAENEHAEPLAALRCSLASSLCVTGSNAPLPDVPPEP